MSARQVVFLGTASQVPTRSRNHNALMLLWDDLGILFDPGEGTQRQMTLACPLEHGVDCYGYRLQEDEGRRMLPERLEAAGVRGPAVGALMRQGTISIEGRTIALDEMSEPKPGQSFAVVMDTRPCAGASRL